MTTQIFYGGDPLETAADIIRAGGLVVFPTETVYGLGASALDADAAANIFVAKGRPGDNPLIIHLSDPSEADGYCITCPLYRQLAQMFMPGPLTVVLPKRDCIPMRVTGGLDTVAVRVPSHPVANRLISLAGVPIAAPSANISGRPSPTRFSHAFADMYGKVNAIIDGGECEIGLESTVISLSDGRITVLRPGGITPDMLRQTGCEVVGGVADDKPFTGTPQAPGMKYRHYAPEAPMTLIDGNDDAFYEYLDSRPDCGVICFDGDLAHMSDRIAVSMGPADDSTAQAHRLFDCLRSFPQGLPHIYARLPRDRDGVGAAVFNRLIKAAGYDVLKL